MNKLIKPLILSTILLNLTVTPAIANQQNATLTGGFISHEEKNCPAAGCLLVCISYATGKVILEQQFRRLTVTQFANSDIRMQGKNGVGELDIYMNTQRAMCHVSS